MHQVFFFVLCISTIALAALGTNNEQELALTESSVPENSSEKKSKEIANQDLALGIQVTNTWADTSEIMHFSKAIAAQLPAHETDKEHLAYNNFVDEKWERLSKLSLEGGKTFQEKELGDLESELDEGQVFYPFGGADMVYPILFFPKSKNYILVGLEPPGNIEQTRNNLDYTVFKNIMENIFNSGFFITAKMTRNMKDLGTLPAMLGLITKMGYDCKKVEEITLKNLKGVRIYFSNKEGEEKRVSYYKGDLKTIDPRIFGPSQIAFIKCCSYLMHGGDFKLIKTYLLQEVPFILQDDTGLPLRDLKKRDNIFYGEYTKPYGDDFPWAKQDDLALVYAQKVLVKELGFRIGYGFGKAPSNLLLSKFVQPQPRIAL